MTNTTTQKGLKLNWTLHIRVRQGEREISNAMVEQTMNAPAVYRPTKEGGKGWHNGIMREYEKVFADGGRVRVIAEVRKQEAWLITAYWVK
jgi:hypothetical protein